MLLISFLAFGVYEYFSAINNKNIMLAQYEKRKKVPNEVWKCLNDSKEMVLFSIDPNDNFKVEKKDIIFHNFKVLGSILVTNIKEQIAITNEITDSVSILNVMQAKCFWPRHAVRITHEKAIYDFLICYHCKTMYLYDGKIQIAEIAIGGSVDVYNEI